MDPIQRLLQLRNEEDTSEGDMRELGLLFDAPASAPYDARWDPDPLPDGDEYPVDPSGLSGEDARGVWLRVHPDVLLENEPQLWSIVDEFWMGRRRITAADLETKSAFELEAKLHLINATTRQERRKLRGEAPPEGEGDGQ